MSTAFDQSVQPGNTPALHRVLVIGCGALAHELVQLLKLNNWSHVDIQCLPAEWHNTPAKIPAGVDAVIADRKDDYNQLFVAYADCGTGGLLDAVIDKWSGEIAIERIQGDHCYQFFSGNDVFANLQEQELGTFYLTDYLARNFQRIIIRGLKIDKHPELKPMYFANYTRLVYLAQSDDDHLDRLAEAAADDLGLTYQRVFTGLHPLNQILVKPVLSKSASASASTTSSSTAPAR